MDKSRIEEILAPVKDVQLRLRERSVRDNFWKTVKRAAKHVPFIDEVVAGYYCALDPDTPFRVRGTLLAALAYFVLPFDIVPDFLVGLGFTDDIAVLTAALTSIRTHITPTHRKAARRSLSEQ